MSWQRLAEIAKAREAWDDAQQCQEKALAILEQDPAAHQDATEAIARLAALKHDRGEYAAAAELQQRVIERMEGGKAPKRRIAIQKQRLANCLVWAGQPAAAVSEAREALSVLQPVLRAGHTDLCGIRFTLAHALWQLEQFEEAAQLLRENLAKCSESDRQATLPMLAGVLLAQGQAAEAEPFARECLQFRAASMPGQWQHYSAMSLLGEALLVQGRLTEAEPLLREAAERMPAAQQALRRALPDAYRRLIRLYEAQGREADAQAWRAKLEPLQQR